MSIRQDGEGWLRLQAFDPSFCSLSHTHFTNFPALVKAANKQAGSLSPSSRPGPQGCRMAMSAAAEGTSASQEKRFLSLFSNQSSDKSNQSPHVYRKLLKHSSSESNKLSLIHILLILSVSLPSQKI